MTLNEAKKIILKEFWSSGPETKVNGFKIKSKTYKDKVTTHLFNILLSLNEISEKSFKLIDKARSDFDAWINDHATEYDSVVTKCESKGTRYQLCAEYCYDKFFKDNNIINPDNSSLKESNEIKSLKKNKIPLTPEERDEVMKAKAVWHHGPNGKPSPAVWKSKDKSGKITFVTNTHRVFNTASTLKGAINRYHKFIKRTA